MYKLITVYNLASDPRLTSSIHTRKKWRQQKNEKKSVWIFGTEGGDREKAWDLRLVYIHANTWLLCSLITH